ncbi:MAG: glycoside hydrolase family 2 TIM barrel-domain containing protein [Bacteroidota bacterium]
MLNAEGLSFSIAAFALFFSLVSIKASAQNNERERLNLQRTSNTARQFPRSEAKIMYLSGPRPDSVRTWDFITPANAKPETAQKIAVPAAWETLGNPGSATPGLWQAKKFGKLNYGNDSLKYREQGLYKYTFQVPETWKGSQVNLVFEGSMTDTEVKINGKSAGPVHRGGYMQFSYNVTNLLKIKKGKDNLLEVTVSKHSSDSSVNLAERNGDFYIFGGIYRPVYLEAIPSLNIESAKIDARPDGSIAVEVKPNRIEDGIYIEAQVFIFGSKIGDGEPFFKAFAKGEDRCIVRGKLSNPRPWTPETPNIYKLMLRLINKNGVVVHSYYQTFGFRQTELRAGDGLYLNGKKIVFKGINYRSSYPLSGPAISYSQSVKDVQLIKEMNMNAVRIAHSPADPGFLHACDSLGLMVIEDLPGRSGSYSPAIAQQAVSELLSRDANHPSIIIWGNDTQQQSSTPADELLEKLDFQHRPIIHPGSLYKNIETANFKPFNCCDGSLYQGKNVFFETETLHGNGDGGLGAGLAERYELVKQTPLSAGLFLWNFADEGILHNDTLRHANGNTADGVFNAYRKPEASFNTIRSVFAPFEITTEALPFAFHGKITIANNLTYTGTDNYTLRVNALKFPLIGKPTEVVKTTSIPCPQSAPGAKIDWQLPANFNLDESDAVQFSILNKAGQLVYDKIISLAPQASIAKRWLGTSSERGAFDVSESSTTLKVSNGRCIFSFDKSNGMLSGAEIDGKPAGIANGPRPSSGKPADKGVTWYKDGKDIVIETTPSGDIKKAHWRINPWGIARLDYIYTAAPGTELKGITFDLPDSLIESFKWFGNGPEKVWQNRESGLGHGLFTALNPTRVKSDTLHKSEFGGYYSGFRYASVKTLSNYITIIAGNDNMYLQVAKHESKSGINNLQPNFPAGELSIMHSIGSMGDKYNAADKNRPAQSPNAATDAAKAEYSGSVWFKFEAE